MPATQSRSWETGGSSGLASPGRRVPTTTPRSRGQSASLTRPGGPLGSLSDLAAIGFKAVHAGPVTGVRLIDEEVLAAMEAVTFLAPAHNPPYVAAMRSFRRVLPQTPLVALFETAFFDRMPESATTYAVPYEWKEELGIRRYGFHGASHRAAAERVQVLLGRPVRHISCHLGGSSSVAGIRDGVAVETSFGLSPQSGLPQNNRVGDLDVFAALFVMKAAQPRPGRDGDAAGIRVGTRGHQRIERRRARPGTGGGRGSYPCAPGARRLRARGATSPGRLPRGARRRGYRHLLRRHRRG